MKPLHLTVFLVFGLSSSLRAHEAHFFRISGPVSTRITGFTVAGATWPRRIGSRKGSSRRRDR